MRDCPAHEVSCYGCHWRIYRCSQCQGCYQCEHTAVYGDGKWAWVCRDGKTRPLIQELCGCQTEEREKQQKDFLAKLLRTPSAPVQDWPF